MTLPPTGRAAPRPALAGLYAPRRWAAAARRSSGRRQRARTSAQLYSGDRLKRDSSALEARKAGLLDRYPLLVVDEVGYLPFDADAASLFFQLVNARYERGSLVVTSNKPFTACGEVFGDPVVAAAMLDRLAHHADILSLKGESYRLKDKRLGPSPEPRTTTD